MSHLIPHQPVRIAYALEINGGEARDHGHFVDAMHNAFSAVEQGARRVVLSRIEDDALTPLCVFTPPEAP